MSEIDKETLAIMRRYCGRDPRQPREIVDTVFHEYGQNTWELDSFLKLLQEAASKIPPEGRATASVSLNGDFDQSTSLTIHYVRSETPEEVAQNVARALEYALDQQRGERATYERLRAKFGRG